MSDRRKNEVLHSRLLKHTLAKAKKSGLPYYWISDQEQRGENFKEKFYHSIQDIFELGYDQLIVIGSDTPQISVQTLIEVENKLSEETFVLGPSNDGGVYLLGLHKQHFKLLCSLNIPWQSGTESLYIRSYWEQKGLSISVLPDLIDLDSYNDLNSVQSRLSHTSVYADLFSALNDKGIIRFYYQPWDEFCLHQDYFKLRAPPQ